MIPGVSYFYYVIWFYSSKNIKMILYSIKTTGRSSHNNTKVKEENLQGLDSGGGEADRKKQSVIKDQREQVV